MDRGPDEVTNADRQAMKKLEDFYFGGKSGQDVSREERNLALEEIFQDSMFR